MKKNSYFAIIITLIFIGSVIYFGLSKFEFSQQSFPFNEKALAEKFNYLSRNGNSSCSAAFRQLIPSMPDTRRLQGSCCSPMSWHRYTEQVKGLQKYRTISEIPPDPYDIEVNLAKRLMSYYDMELTLEEQKAYDYAMENSEEKGPCCCKCWRWYVYGGLGKYLIHKYKFTGQQVAEVWNLSDGCGGDEHNH
jgi:hypothetical protein